MYVVSETARKNNERIVGLTCDKLAKMSAIEEKNWHSPQKWKKVLSDEATHYYQDEK